MNYFGTEHFELIQRVGYHEYLLGRYATRSEAQDAKRMHLGFAESGLTKESRKMARFYDRNHQLIAEQPVTADECFNTLAVPCYWSNFYLADGPTASRLGAFSAAFVPDWEQRP